MGFFSLSNIKRAPKVAAWTGVALAGAAAVGAWAVSARNRAKRDAKEELANADMQELQPPVQQPMMQPGMMMPPQQPQDPNAMMAAQPNQQMMQPQATPMGTMPADQMGPAEGRQPNEWQNRVAAERGMGTMGHQEGPAQPNQSVMPESSVQDLGSAKADETPQPPTR